MTKYLFKNYLYNILSGLMFFVFISSYFIPPKANANSNFKIDHKNGFIKNKQSLSVIIVKRQVKDEKGIAIEGVRVLLKKRAKEVKTDVNGKYFNFLTDE